MATRRIRSLLMGPFFALLWAVSCLLPSPLTGQSRDRGPLVLDLPSSTRAMALGNAFVLGYRDSDALFYHPGVLDRVQGMSASLQRYSTRGRLMAVSAGTDWWSGGVALGAQVLAYEAPATRPISGQDVLELPDHEASLRERGDVSVSEMVLSAGYGREMFGIRLGLVGKLVDQRFGPLRGSTAAIDVGAALAPGPFTLALSARNLGWDLTLGGEDIPLPTHLALGASSPRVPVGPLDLAATPSLDYRVDGDVISSAGMEVAYWPVVGRTFVARVGYAHVPQERQEMAITFGGGFTGDDIILEYAYQGFDTGDPTHRFGIGWR